MNFIELLKSISLSQLILLSLILNFGLYFLSIATYYLFANISNRPVIQKEYQKLKKSDIILSVIVVIANSSVLVLGWFLWKNDFIIIKNSTWIQSFAEVFLLILAMDLAMYIFHRTAHQGFFYRYIHSRHHEHQSVNSISLFVLHPLESIGFGLIMIGILMIYSFSQETIGIYVMINLIWGTLGHLNIEIFPKRFAKLFLLKYTGTVTFHNLHHQSPQNNFGFYTLIWDKLFGTFSPDYEKEFDLNSGKQKNRL